MMDYHIHQLQQHHMLKHPPVPKKTSSKAVSNFKTILAKQECLKLSKHAAIRLQERNIHIGEKQWQTISQKVVEARQKGITDSLVVTNDAALLVSTANNTVVTAMGRNEATSRIFTNINGTILINE